MAYPAALETRPALSHEVWEQTPPKAQAYIQALEARVATLEGMMQALQDQLNQTSRNSSRPPSSDPPPKRAATPSSEYPPSWWSTGPSWPYPTPCACGRSR